MTAKANNHESNASGDHGTNAGRYPQLKQGLAKTALVIPNNNDCTTLNMNDGFFEAAPIINKIVEARVSINKVIEGVSEMVTQWLESHEDVVSSYMYIHETGLHFEFITEGFEHDHELDEQISEFCLQIEDRFPGAPVSINLYAKEVYDGPGMPSIFN